MPIENVKQYELKQVELMQAGVSANGLKFTSDDLQGIADAYRALGLDGRVPLKLGHNDEQPLTDGKPALGWCRNLRVVGDKLVGDLTDLPKLIYDAFKTGRYKNVSVELLKNVQAGTRIIPWVIDAVALLGADQPAFGSLRDLQSLTMARGHALMHESRATFSMARAESAEAVRAEYEAKLNKLKVDGVIEVAIASGRVAPAAREIFRNVFKGEAYTVTNWQVFAATQPKPHYGPARVLRRVHDDGTGDAQHTDASPDATMVRLTRAYIDEMDKRGKVVSYEEAARVVMRRDPEATRAWLDMNVNGN